MDQGTKKDIETLAWTILKDAGLTKPPINVDDLIAHLKLYRDFYSLDDPTFVRKLVHKFDVKLQSIVSAVRKSKLVAAWFPDSSKILIDNSLPILKQKWPQFHEIGHSVIPWHKEFFLGDTAQMLDPEYQEMLEAEANFIASEFMFCGPMFREQALESKPEWNSITALSKAFGTTATTTLRKFVESRPETPLVAFISTPRWLAKPADQPQRWRYCIRSKSFAHRFGKILPGDLLEKVDLNIAMRRGGPVGTFVTSLSDDNNVVHEFLFESFFNRYQVLTLVTYLRAFDKKKIIIA